MRRYRTTYLGLLADDHALQHTWVVEAEGAGDGGMLGRECEVAEGWGKGVEGVPDLVDRLRSGVGETICCGRECICCIRELVSC